MKTEDENAPTCTPYLPDDFVFDMSAEPCQAVGMKITLKWDGSTGDGKRAFVVAEENDGWNDLRIELDTDDCNSSHARTVMQEIIDRVNRAN